MSNDPFTLDMFGEARRRRGLAGHHSIRQLRPGRRQRRRPRTDAALSCPGRAGKGGRTSGAPAAGNRWKLLPRRCGSRLGQSRGSRPRERRGDPDRKQHREAGFHEANAKEQAQLVLFTGFGLGAGEDDVPPPWRDRLPRRLERARRLARKLLFRTPTTRRFPAARSTPISHRSSSSGQSGPESSGLAGVAAGCSSPVSAQACFQP